MSFSDHKITAFTHRIADLPDQPNLPADELKARFDSSPEELRTAHNAVCDDADRLEARVEGIVAETCGATTTEDMLSDELAGSVAWKSVLYFGYYTGDGVYPREINLGFAPRVVYVRRADGFSGYGSEIYVMLAIASDQPETDACVLTANGFRLNNESGDNYLVSVKYEYEKTSHASVKAWLVFQNQIFIYVERQRSGACAGNKAVAQSSPLDASIGALVRTHVR